MSGFYSDEGTQGKVSVLGCYDWGMRRYIIKWFLIAEMKEEGTAMSCFVSSEKLLSDD